jgi:hypothetical protein
MKEKQNNIGPGDSPTCVRGVIFDLAMCGFYLEEPVKVNCPTRINLSVCLSLHPSETHSIEFLFRNCCKLREIGYFLTFHKCTFVEFQLKFKVKIRFMEKYFCLGYCEQEIVINVH